MPELVQATGSTPPADLAALLVRDLRELGEARWIGRRPHVVQVRPDRMVAVVIVEPFRLRERDPRDCAPVVPEREAVMPERQDRRARLERDVDGYRIRVRGEHRVAEAIGA